MKLILNLHFIIPVCVSTCVCARVCGVYIHTLSKTHTISELQLASGTWITEVYLLPLWEGTDGSPHSAPP